MNSDRRPRPVDAVSRAKASVDFAVARGIEPATSVNDDDLLDRLDPKPVDNNAHPSAGDNNEIGERSFRVTR